MLTVNKEELLTKVQELVDTLSKADLSADAHVFVQSVFQIEAVSEFLIYVSRLPVFDKAFSHALSHDLDLLALGKKLK